MSPLFQRTEPMQLRTVKRVKLDGGELLDQSLELCANAAPHINLVLGRGARMLGSIRPNFNAQNTSHCNRPEHF